MTRAELDRLAFGYRDGLLNDVVPFWMHHAVDHEHGGFITSLDRDGSIIDTDKQLWQQGRFAWLLATLYNTVEPRTEWLDLARHGIDFIRHHGFDSDGRMHFLVTREGEPLRKRRYAFGEAFAAMAFAAYGKAANDADAAEEGRLLLKRFVRYTTTPGLLEPKVRPETRPMLGLGPFMIRINCAQTVRDTVGMPECNGWIDDAIDTIERCFVNETYRAVLETAGPNGEFIDHFDGRTITPGHAIEAAWFILHEAKHRGGDERLLKLGLKMLDWTWDWGWDAEHGGIVYFRDVKRIPIQEYWHDMKFWWPQNEAIIATLLAYQLTGNPKYAAWHGLVHDWAHDCFPDPDYGEWFGYLHRDGRISTALKGNHWKGAFHIPRMQWYCWRLCDDMRAAQTP